MVWGKLFLCSVNLTPVIKKKNKKCGKGSVWLSSVTWVEFRRKRRIYTGWEYRHTDSHTRRPIQRYMHTQSNICRLCMVNMLTLNNSQRKTAEIKEQSRSCSAALAPPPPPPDVKVGWKALDMNTFGTNINLGRLWFAEHALQCNMSLFYAKELVTKTT